MIVLIVKLRLYISLYEVIQISVWNKFVHLSEMRRSNYNYFLTEICVVTGFYAVWIGSVLRTFRDKTDC